MHIAYYKANTENILGALQKENQRMRKVVDTLYQVNIDIINSVLFDNNYSDLVIRSIAFPFHDVKNVIDDIEWWLYEDVDKIITLKDGTEVDVTTLKDYTNYLFEFYKLMDG